MVRHTSLTQAWPLTQAAALAHSAPGALVPVARQIGSASPATA